jgi:hypothetical protein
LAGPLGSSSTADTKPPLAVNEVKASWEGFRPSLKLVTEPNAASLKEQNPDTEKAQIAASRKTRVSRSKLMTNPDKLQITESRRGGQQSWTVKGRRRDKKNGHFRVRIADAGYRVGLVYRDASGARREPYCCYLSAKEWQAAKKGTIQIFARTITSKIEQRKASGETDTSKLNDLLRRVRAFG